MDIDYMTAILNSDNDTALKAFLFNYNDTFEKNDDNESCVQAADIMLRYLINMNIGDLIKFIDKNQNLINEINAKNIPQFSDINYLDTIISIVKTNPDGDYELFGYYYNKNANRVAHTKYGENHYKMASFLGLVTRKSPFRVTYFGESYMRLSHKEKLLIRPKIFLKIPIIQRTIISSLYGNAYPTELMRNCLSESTVIRRRSNVKTIVKEICQYTDSINFEDKIIWD